MATPSLKFLKTFQIAAKRESFKAAADELCLTASAVSHQIKTLEEQLGVVLFERGAHSLTLTDAGAEYLSHLDVVFQRLDQATEQLRRRFMRRSVRLQVPSFFASELLVPRLNGFSQANPDIDLQITARLPQQDAPADDVDVAVLVSAKPAAELHSVYLFPQVFVPAGAPTLLAKLHLNKVEELLKHTLIVHEGRLSLWEQWAAAQGMQDLHPKHVIRFDSMTAAVDAAQNGVGLALVSERLARNRFANGALTKAWPDELPTGESYFVLTRTQDYLRPEVQVLVQWLAQQFGDRQPKSN